MFVLDCLLTNNSAKLVAKAMRSLSDIIIADDPNAKVTIKDLHKELKDAGIDIDLQSTAFIYSTEFFNDIQKYHNFENEEAIKAYATKIPNVTKETKDALIAAGYGKTLSNGKTILDWTKLMGKSEDEIKQEIKDKGIPNEGEVFNSLQKEWKQIISNAIMKSENKLNDIAKPKDIQRNQKSALDKLSELYSMGVNNQFGDTYKSALRKYLGVSEIKEDAMNAIDNIAKQARELGKFGLSADNDIEQNMQKEINSLIASAQYADMTTLNKIVHGLSTAIDFGTLRLLNNPANVTENYTSGKGQEISDASQYTKAPEFVKRASKSKAKDIIVNGASDYGTEHNMFLGERNNVDHVREVLANRVESERGKRLLNTAYNMATGIWGLNAMDSRFKLQSTWQRFFDATSKLYMSKTGATQKEADKWLNEQVTGEKYEQAKQKSKEIISYMQSKGYKIDMSQEKIDLLTADVIKAQILNNSPITKDQLEVAFKAAYHSAGRSMAHVPNNYLSTGLSAIKMQVHQGIKKALKDNNQSKLTSLMLADMAVNKLGLRFIGGGTNWVVLQLEKTGAGAVVGVTLGLRDYSQDYKKLKHLSDYKNAELKDVIQNTQKNNDRFFRGVNYGLANLAVLGLGMSVWSKLSEDDKKKYVHTVEKNPYINKYVNKLLPTYLAAYNAYLMDKYKNEKINDKEYLSSYFWQNLLNQKTGDNNDLIAVSRKTYDILNDHKAKDEKKEEALGQLGEVFGKYFNVDIIPMGKWYKDAIDAYKQANEPLSKTHTRPKGFLQGYENNTILRSAYEKNGKK
jgi:hypothetical protein